MATKTMASPVGTSTATTTSKHAEPTLSTSSAVRRLADTLYQEAQEKDPSLCQTHDTSFRNFLAHLLDRGTHGGAQVATTTSSATTASEQATQPQQQPQPFLHGRGVLTDDADRFSKRCDEARIESVSLARQIIDAVFERRRQQQLQQQLQQDEEIQIDYDVIYLSEWRLICRQHPGLLITSLNRSMPRSETTATALVADTPVTILPARERPANAGKNQQDDEDAAEEKQKNKNDKKKKREREQQQQQQQIVGDTNQQQQSQTQQDQQQQQPDQDEQQQPEGKHTGTKKQSLSDAVFSGWTYATDWAQRAHQWLERFVAGGIAGGVAKSVIAPGDRVKIIFQVNRNLVFSIAAAFGIAHTIIKRNGPLGLWAGHGATLLRVVPYASISFASFEFYHLTFRGIILRPEELEAENRKQKKKTDGAGSGRQILLRFVCGAAAGATATTVTYPLDLLRARYAAHSLHSAGTPYPSYLTGLKQIYRQEGIAKLYSGLGPTLLGIIPYAGASFTVFETLKAFVLSRNQKSQQSQQQQSQHGDDKNEHHQQHHDEIPQELATWQRLTAGALSGLVAQSLTYPLDIVRRRMQVHPEESRNMMHTLKTIYREEGIRRGLYKGLTMNWVKGPIAVGVSFTINDYIKHRTQAYHARVALQMDDDDEEQYTENVAEATREAYLQRQLQTQLTPKATTAQQVEQQNNHQQSEQDNSINNKPLKKKSISSSEAARRYLHLTERLACGAVAGAAAKIWTIPFDRLKLMMALGRIEQDEGVTPGNKFRTVLKLLRQSQNPWQGTAGMMLRVAPFAAVSYTVFDAVQPAARRVILTRDPTLVSDMIAGGVAGALATVVCQPMDVLRSKVALAQDGAPPFASYLQGLRNVDSVKSLYVGLRPALIGVCPLAAISFAVYHGGKRRYDDGSFSCRLMLGAAAGLAGQIVSYPFNIIRRHAVAEEAQAVESVASTVRQALVSSGEVFPKMYRRMPMGWTFGTATFAVSFALHDWLRDQVIALRRRQSRDLLLKDPTVQ